MKWDCRGLLKKLLEAVQITDRRFYYLHIGPYLRIAIQNKESRKPQLLDYITSYHVHIHYDEW